VDVWLIRILVLNGLGFFATWVSIATSLNFGQFLSYSCAVEPKLASSICLVVISLLFIAYFLIDNFFWPKYSLYLFTPWIVVNVALVGSVTKNWVNGAPTRNNIVTLAMLIVTFLFGMAKIVMFVLYKTALRNKIRPQRASSPVDTASLQRSDGADTVRDQF
jgi:hypothetical protein